MDAETILTVLFRWIHVGVAVVLAGGAAFSWLVLVPAAAELPDAEHAALKERVQRRWKRIVMIGILLLLISGFYNYLQVTAPAHQGVGRYHMLMGIKILLAFVVFFLASVMTGRSATFEKMRQQPGKWLSILVILAGVVIALGGVLKVAFPPVAPPAEVVE